MISETASPQLAGPSSQTLFNLNQGRSPYRGNHDA